MILIEFINKKCIQMKNNLFFQIGSLNKLDPQNLQVSSTKNYRKHNYE